MKRQRPSAQYTACHGDQPNRPPLLITPPQPRLLNNSLNSLTLHHAAESQLRHHFAMNPLYIPVHSLNQDYSPPWSRWPPQATPELSYRVLHHCRRIGHIQTSTCPHTHSCSYTPPGPPSHFVCLSTLNISHHSPPLPPTPLQSGSPSSESSHQTRSLLAKVGLELVAGCLQLDVVLAVGKAHQVLGCVIAHVEPADLQGRQAGAAGSGKGSGSYTKVHGPDRPVV